MHSLRRAILKLLKRPLMQACLTRCAKEVTLRRQRGLGRADHRRLGGRRLQVISDQLAIKNQESRIVYIGGTRARSTATAHSLARPGEHNGIR